MNHSALDLDVQPFPRILADLCRNDATGTLSLSFQNLEKRIVVQNGIPVCAESNIVEETLGHFLVKRGDVDETTAYQALSKSVESGRHLGEILVEMGALSPHDLFDGC